MNEEGKAAAAAAVVVVIPAAAAEASIASYTLLKVSKKQKKSHAEPATHTQKTKCLSLH
jgi:hypothetical protein